MYKYINIHNIYILYYYIYCLSYGIILSIEKYKGHEHLLFSTCHIFLQFYSLHLSNRNKIRKKYLGFSICSY